MRIFKQKLKRFILRRKLLAIGMVCITIFLPIALLLARLPKQTEAAWFDDNYSYRQSFSFTHNADITSERAITFSLDTAELISAGVMQSDCDDTRFTDINGKLLTYQLTGSCNNAATTYEVVFPSIINGANPAYVYYGNPAASSGSISVSGVTALTPSGGDPAITDRASEAKGPGPKLALKFDEGYGTTTNDNTINNNDGALSGAAWRSEEFCYSNNCLIFDGSDDVVTVTNANSIDMDQQIAGAMTFQAWIRANSDGENDVGQIFQKGTNTFLRVDSQGSDGLADIEASLALASTNATLNVADAITVNRWHHVAVAYTDDGDDEITIYVDGKSVGTSSDGSGAPASDSNNLLVGGTTTANFHGFIDEFKVYDYERTAAQIATDLPSQNTEEGISSVYGLQDTKYLSNGLVAYYTAEEGTGTSTADKSGVGTTGTFYEGTTSGSNGPTWTTGKFGHAINFAGTNDVVRATETTSTDLGATTDSYTVGLWFKTTADTGGHQDLINKDNGGTNAPFRLYINGSERLSFAILESSSTIQATNTTAVNDGVWHHAVGVRDRQARTINLYIDGTFITSTSDTSTSAINNDADISLGAGSTNYNNNDYTGQIDNIRVYNRAFSPSEVQSLYRWAPGPVGYWKIDEATGTTTQDSSTNGSSGTLTNMETGDRITGKVGGAVDFDGSNEFIDGTDASALDMGTGSFTVSAWVWRDTATTIDNIFSKKNSGVGNTCTTADHTGYHFVIYDTDELSIGFCDGTNGTEFFTAANAVATGGWHHVSAAVDRLGETAKIYVDGVSVSVTENRETATFPANSISNTEEFGIGIQNDGVNGADFWDGKIDEVKVYSYARTSSQVVSDMNAGHPVVGTPFSSPAGYWSLDEGTGTTANDNSVNDNDLTLSAAGWTNSGKFDKAYDGATNRRLTRDDDSDFDFANGSDDFTISTWFNRGGTISNQEYLIDKHATNDGYTVYMDSDGDIVCGIGDGAAAFPEETIGGTLSKNYDDSNWHHAVCVKSGTSSLRLYVDGKEIASDTSLAVDADMSNSGKLIVGDTNETDGTDEWLGDIDEIKIYRAALSADQVYTEYNQAKSQVFGSTSTASDGTTADNSAARSYCVPGDTTSCSAPVAEWRFDETSGTTANDTSTAGNAGTLTNGPSWGNGKFGSAVNFDGGNDEITTNYNITETAAYTLSFWVYPRTLADNDTFASWNTAGLHSLYMSSNAIRWCNDNTCAGASVEASSNTSVLTTGAWNHLVATYDGSGTAAIYVNGVNQTADATLSETADSDGLVIGQFEDTTPTNAVDGLIDNFRVYDYARTPQQVAWEYNRGAPIAHWQFDECSGTTANDASGNSLSGTITTGASGNTAAGTCTSGNSAHAWNNGASGKFNASLDFDGTDDWVDMSDPSSGMLDMADSQDFSIEAWVNRDTFSSDDSIIAKKNDTATAVGYQLYIDGTTDDLNFVVADTVGEGSDSFSMNSLGTINATGWHHVVVVFDEDSATNSTIYIDGKSDKESSSGTIGNVGSTANNLVFRVGSESDDGRPFDGKIDNVKIYKYALTSNQVKTAYNENAAVRFAPLTGTP